MAPLLDARLGAVLGVAVLSLVLAGCADTATTTSDPAADQSTASERDATPVEDVDDGSGDVEQPSRDDSSEPEAAAGLDPATADAVFLTAVDGVVAGSGLQGVVDADPGGFLDLATTVCDLLDEGAEPALLLDATVQVLGDAAGGVDAEVATLSGGIVGAAVEVYCPSHGDSVAMIAEQGQG